MTSVDIVTLLVLAIALLVFIGEPLIRKPFLLHERVVTNAASERLELQKEVLYTALYDLDFDFHTYKVDQQDYTALRQQLEGEAVQILRQIDALAPHRPLDEALEGRIAAFRQQYTQVAASNERLACPHCGTALQGNENFCPACGQPPKTE